MFEEDEETQGAESRGGQRGRDLKREVYNMIERRTRQDVVDGTQGLDALDGMLEEELGLGKQQNPTLRLKEYLDKQEQEMKNINRKLAQKMVQQELDEQVKEKRQRHGAKREEDAEYVRASEQMMECHRRRKSAEHKKMLEDKAKLRNMQLKIVDRRKAKIQHEQRISDEQDRQLVRGIQEDLAAQKTIQVERIAKKRDEMREVMRENQKRRAEKEAVQALVRQEENDLQLRANKISEEMELQRMREIEDKKTKMHLLFVQ